MTPDEIREVRLQLGLSHREFATAIGLSGKNGARGVQRFETGELFPSQETEEKIKSLTHVP